MDMGVTVLVGFRGHAIGALIISRWNSPPPETSCSWCSNDPKDDGTSPENRASFNMRRAERTYIYNHKHSLKVVILMGQSEELRSAICYKDRPMDLCACEL